jgi:hypothetical protein
MHFGEIIAGIALLFGAVLGLIALFNPDWASRLVRLVPDPAADRPGGYSEFRATYGGLFLLSHLMTLVIMLRVPDPVMSMIVCLPLAMGWLGAAMGRLFSLILDKAKNRQTGPLPMWASIELTMAVALLLPILQFRT